MHVSIRGSSLGALSGYLASYIAHMCALEAQSKGYLLVHAWPNGHIVTVDDDGRMIFVCQVQFYIFTCVRTFV